MKLREAVGIEPGEVVSLVGAGGKTTLMFALANEVASSGNSVITTTTTKIMEPLLSQTERLLLSKDEDELLELARQNLLKYRHITLASERLDAGRLKGISPGLVVRLAELKPSCVIVEADGAARRSLKAPNATEPVIPDNTSLVIPVVGIDVLGCPLREEHVFRAEIAAKLLGVPLGVPISAEFIAFLITCPQGIIKGSPQQARIIPFINKVELDAGLSKSRDLARKIMAVGYRIKQVVLGRAQSQEPVVEVVGG